MSATNVEAVMAPEQIADRVEREPTRQELIDRMWAAHLRAQAIEGTDDDPLVQVERMLEEDERRWEAYVRSQRWRRLSPFPWHWK